MLTRRQFCAGALSVGLVSALHPVFAAPQWSIADMLRLDWRDLGNGEPLLQPPAWSPILADPAVVLPGESPDGRWHLFAHTALGIHHYTSDEGLRWQHEGMPVWHGMRAFVLSEARTFRLYYEAYAPFALVRTALPEALRSPWHSRIALRQSSNLSDWSEPRTLLEPALGWQQGPLGAAVGNPCVLRLSDAPGPAQWGLYYSGGLVFIPDCGFTEPAAIGLATAASPDGPWHAGSTPMLQPSKDDAAHNLSAGAIKVVRVADGFVGFHNAISIQNGRSVSALYLLWSHDGKTWQRKPRPVLMPGDKPWRGSHVYACDVRYEPKSAKWWLFYNARNASAMSEGREAIGALQAG